MTLAAGVVVAGAYRIVRPLAESETGLIYEAEELSNRARRALKMLHGPASADDELSAKFVREVRRAAQIPSIHVARVFDAGRDPATGLLYLVTELLDGSTLASVLVHSGAFPAPTAIALLEQIAEALSAAHILGIVHRDLQPANIFLAPQNRGDVPFAVKLLDFGVASALATSLEGAPAWMAPEQFTSAAAILPHADIWSFGLLAFMLVTGKHYFLSANLPASPTSAIAHEALSEPLVAASERAAKLGVAHRLPAQFDEWFARCVQREPDKRFADIRVAQQELAALFRVTATSQPSPMPRTVYASALSDQTQSDAGQEEEPTSVGTRRAARARGNSGHPHTPMAMNAAPAPAVPPRWTGVALVAAAALLGIALALALVTRTRAGQGSVGATSPASSSGFIVRLHGSNTIGAELAPALAEAFLRRQTGSENIVRRRTAPDEMVIEARESSHSVEAIEIAAHGSATAFEDLLAGRCDIGMASRRIHPEEAAKLLSLGDLSSPATEQVIALDGIAVIVNPINPVSSLTRSQLRDIFAGNVRRWSEVSAAPGPIVVHARDDKSGTYDTFRSMVLQGGMLVAGAKRHESSEELSDAVAADPNAIGFIGLPYIRSAKPLAVQDEGSSAMLPSPLTVSAEDYPLSRRLNLYVPLGASALAHDFVDFVQSDEGQKVVESAGFVDLRPECDPNAARCAPPDKSAAAGAADARCTREYRSLIEGSCRLSLNFRFVRDSFQLDSRALRDLQRIASVMRRAEYAGRSVVLLGFSDANGPRANNLSLSQQRAAGVAEQLRARGVRVAVERGLGPDMPVADNATEEGRQRNRRVEVWLR